MSDALGSWLEVRPRLTQLAVKPRLLPIRGARDGYAAFVRQWVMSRDPERACALSRAHELSRADAEREAALSFSLIASWQEVVLGGPAPFRDGPAFAKGGAERYGSSGDTAARFEACLRDADIRTEALAMRATRAYLDVCFFHPFRDGNARAASLLLDFVFFREGVVLDQLAPLFVVSRRPTLTDASEFLRLLEILLDAAASR